MPLGDPGGHDPKWHKMASRLTEVIWIFKMCQRCFFHLQDPSGCTLGFNDSIQNAVIHLDCISSHVPLMWVLSKNSLITVSLESTEFVQFESTFHAVPHSQVLQLFGETGEGVTDPDFSASWSAGSSASGGRHSFQSSFSGLAGYAISWWSTLANSHNLFENDKDILSISKHHNWQQLKPIHQAAP